jgi:hypothetical protein
MDQFAEEVIDKDPNCDRKLITGMPYEKKGEV